MYGMSLLNLPADLALRTSATITATTIHSNNINPHGPVSRKYIFLANTYRMELVSIPDSDTEFPTDRYNAWLNPSKKTLSPVRIEAIAHFPSHMPA